MKHLSFCFLSLVSLVLVSQAQAAQVSCEARSRAVPGAWYGQGFSVPQAQQIALDQCDAHGPRRHCYIASCRGDGIGEPGRRYTCTYFSTSTGQSYYGTSNDQSEATRIALGECDRNGPQRHCKFHGCTVQGLGR